MAVASGIKNSPFIGIDEFHIAKLLTDDETGATYDEIISFPWLRSVQIEPETADDTLYADNHAVAVANATNKYNLTIETATLPIEYRGLLLGHTVENGVMKVHGDDAAPYFCIKFTINKQNGKKRYVMFPKTQFSEPSENPQTKEENTTFNTPTINATAIYRDWDRISLIQADEEAADYAKITGDSWYTAIEPVTSTTP